MHKVRIQVTPTARVTLRNTILHEVLCEMPRQTYGALPTWVLGGARDTA